MDAIPSRLDETTGLLQGGIVAVDGPGDHAAFLVREGFQGRFQTFDVFGKSTGEHFGHVRRRSGHVPGRLVGNEIDEA